MHEARDERVKQMLEEATDAIIKIGAPAAAATATAVAAGAVPLAVAAAGVAAAVPPTLGHIALLAKSWKQRDVSKWWHRVLFGPSDDRATPEEIAGLIDAHVEEPFVQDTVLRSVRALYDAVDPRVVVPLGVLARQYLRERRPPDGFFRGACRLFSELSGREFDDLQVVVSAAARCCREASGEVVVLKAGTEREEPDELGIEYDAPGEYKRRDVRGLVDPARLVRLVLRSDLALNEGVRGGSYHGESAIMVVAVVRSLAVLVSTG